MIHLGKDSVTLLTKGVGYEVFVPSATLGDLTLDAHISFWVHTVVRDDGITLFGFLTKEQRHLFVSLLKVDRIGPKKGFTNPILKCANRSNYYNDPIKRY